MRLQEGGGCSREEAAAGRRLQQGGGCSREDTAAGRRLQQGGGCSREEAAAGRRLGEGEAQTVKKMLTHEEQKNGCKMPTLVLEGGTDFRLLVSAVVRSSNCNSIHRHRWRY
jgi:hypothetical protein